MLESLEGKKIIDIPKKNQKDWKIWRGRLSDCEFEKICDEIEKKIDDDIANNNDVQVSGWIPGNNWENTVYDPIWSKACGKSFQQSGWCFGNIVWWIMINRRQETWTFLKQDHISSMIYFIKKKN